jgi:hypothetical protein
MRRGLLLGAVMVTLSACGAPETGIVDAQRGSPAIAIDEGACETTCPVYQMTLRPAGDYTLNGERFVKITGVQTGDLGEDAWAAAEDALESAGFWKMKPDQTAKSLSGCQTGAPTVKVTWRTEDGKEKTVTYDAGCDEKKTREMVAALRSAFEFDNLVWTSRKFDYGDPS